MPDQSRAVVVKPPPAALLRVVNPIFRFMLHTPGLNAATKNYMALGFTGRKSGRHYEVPVTAHRLNGDLCVVTSAGWKANFRDGAPVDVTFNGTTSAMRGELISDAKQVAACCLRCTDTYGAKGGARMLGMQFRDNALPSADDFVEAAQEEHVVLIRLTPSG